MATDFIGCRFESRILLFVSFSSVGALGVGHDGFYTTQDYPEHWRRIRFNDPESGKTLIFLTHNTALPTLTIAALYKSRWQVELFFNWIKQHRRIKKFLDNSENAVKTPIGCAVCSWPSSRRSSSARPRATPCYRFYRSRFSRNPRP